MTKFFERVIKRTFKLIGYEIIKEGEPAIGAFLSHHYLRHNQRRQEHLASLGLNIAGSTVLEVGAGIGDHSSFFIDRGCHIVISEARKENIKTIKSRYPNVKILQLDLNNSPKTLNESFDIVYCYGVLYHTHDPAMAIEFMANCCKEMLLLSTRVSFGNEGLVNLVPENAANPAQSISGTGCRPTRKWIYDHLKKHFKHVYLPITQPNHEEFPVDWNAPKLHKSDFARAVFIASNEKIDNKFLKEEIPMKQERSN